MYLKYSFSTKNKITYMTLFDTEEHVISLYSGKNLVYKIEAAQNIDSIVFLENSYVYVERNSNILNVCEITGEKAVMEVVGYVKIALVKYLTTNMLVVKGTNKSVEEFFLFDIAKNRIVCLLPIDFKEIRDVKLDDEAKSLKVLGCYLSKELNKSERMYLSSFKIHEDFQMEFVEKQQVINDSCINLHIHSHFSDGLDSIMEIAEASNREGLQFIAVTDHDYLPPYEEFLKIQASIKKEFDVILLKGTEVSSTYVAPNGEKEVIHIVVIFPEAQKKVESFEENIISKNNNYNRRFFIQQMLDKAEEVIGVKVSVDELEKRFKYLGRKQVALVLGEKMNPPQTMEYVLEEYVGSRGKRRAYVDNPYKYCHCSMEEIVNEVKKCKGIPILAHPLRYFRNKEQMVARELQQELVSAFVKCAGPIGCIEAEYAPYTNEQRQQIYEMIRMTELECDWKILSSAGSDYHGDPKQVLNYGFSSDIWDNMLDRWCETNWRCSDGYGRSKK